jgi:hypothetical protein
LGKSPFTLRHELTRQGTAKFALTDAEACTQYALEIGQQNPLRVLNAFAQNCGAVVLLLPSTLPGQDDTFKGLAEAAKAFSDFVGSVATSVADGVVSANELRDVGRELSKLIGRAQAIEACLSHMHEANRPSALSRGPAA